MVGATSARRCGRGSPSTAGGRRGLGVPHAQSTGGFGKVSVRKQNRDATDFRIGPTKSTLLGDEIVGVAVTPAEQVLMDEPLPGGRIAEYGEALFRCVGD